MSQAPKKPKPKPSKAITDLPILDHVYVPDVLSSYSNSSGTLSYVSVHERTLREHNDMRKQRQIVQKAPTAHKVVEKRFRMGTPQSAVLVDKYMLCRLVKHARWEMRRRNALEIVTEDDPPTDSVLGMVTDAFDAYLAKPAGCALHMQMRDQSRVTIQMVPVQRIRDESGGAVTDAALTEYFKPRPLAMSNDFIEAQLAASKQDRKLQRKINEARRKTLPAPGPVMIPFNVSNILYQVMRHTFTGL